uniref:DUF7883 domain-containing protein n=1 Tax=Trypanosoma congolense (strain IL3000) TaxID=1068625 RepID=G0UPN6_TRYCI|nr:conserved hypothetical protein [Trypanosoma congolense IL3000]
MLLHPHPGNIAVIDSNIFFSLAWVHTTAPLFSLTAAEGLPDPHWRESKCVGNVACLCLDKMRLFRPADSSITSIARMTLACTRRFNLTQKDEDMLCENVRVILRRYGALPLPRVASMLNDEVLELMPNVTGGLGQYVKDRPSKFHVEVASSGLTVVMLASELRHAGGGSPIVGKVLANLAVAPNQQLHIAHLFRSLPPLEQRKCGNERLLESFLLLHTSLVTIQNSIVRMVPTSARGRVGLSSSGPSVAASAGFSASGQASKQGESLQEPTVVGRALDDPKLNRLLLFLQKRVPLSFYVPLRSVIATPRSASCFSQDASVEDILADLQRIPTNFLDCRVIGDGLDDVFLRMMDAEIRPYVSGVTSTSPEYEVLHLGKPLIDAFRALASSSAENNKRLRAGIAMTELGDVLPPDLRQRLHMFQTAHKDMACIFIFDRLRHLFDVNMTACMVRPWEVLERHEQPSSLTWRTTPIPVVLRHVLQLLERKPLSPQELVDGLSPKVRDQLYCAYDSVDVFVEQHSLYLLMRDGLVWTPYLAAVSQGARVPAAHCAGARRSLNEKEKAKVLMEALPVEHPVVWNRFCSSPVARDLPFNVKEIRPEFFERNREFFRVYEALYTTKLVVGRRDGVPPPAELLHQPCRTLADLVRMIALLTVGGTQEATILNLLSREARTMVRRYGSVVQIAKQLPMWFDVREENHGGTGSAIISYIGTGGIGVGES